ncbi:peptidoglycan-binding protein [Streptomyces sp. NPDC050658]|uniref:peptidoglycan-binding protein n=1 Tax=unclassified Streptomyces TaxID=2593676 RepID=UPI0034360228
MLSRITDRLRLRRRSPHTTETSAEHTALLSEVAPQHQLTEFPGTRFFHLGAENPYVGTVRAMLIDRGAGDFYTLPVTSEWTVEDRQACMAFQRAQGWEAHRATGTPDADTWRLLVNDYGCDVVRTQHRALTHKHPSGENIDPSSVPEFPGDEYFGPGQANVWVLMLRLRLITHGGADDQRALLDDDPALDAARTWDEGLRYACTRYQLSLGWRGTAADGYPTLETWTRLFAFRSQSLA